MRNFTIKSVFVTRTYHGLNYHHFEFTISDANLLETRSLSREFTMSSLSVLRIHYGFILFFAESLGIPYLFHEFALISLSNTQIHNEFTSELFYDYSRINYDLTISKANSL